MFGSRVPLFAIFTSLLLLQACAGTATDSAAVDAPVATSRGASEVDLRLNLPDQPVPMCPCEQGVDYTFLDKGFDALVAGDTADALNQFQRYQRLESSPEADWEVGIATAFSQMLSGNPDRDPAAAAVSFLALDQRPPAGRAIHTKVLIMRDALETLVAMEQAIGKLQDTNALLTEDLQKREDALKRLRELTLGQKAGAP